MRRNGNGTTVETFEKLYGKFEGRCNLLKIKPSTMDQYTLTMGRFIRWADDQNIPPAELVARDVLDYTSTLTRLNGQSYKTETLRSHCRSLKTLLNFAADYDYIPEKIKVEMPKAPESEIKALNDQELKSVIEHVEARADSSPSPRDAAIVHVLKDSGVRSAELCALDWSDLSWDEDRQLGTIKVDKQLNRKREFVSVKNGRPRETFFYADAWHYLRMLRADQTWALAEIAQKTRVDQGLPVNEWPDLSEVDVDFPGPVFRRSKGSNHLPGRIGNSGLSNMLETAGEKLGIHLNPHLFRHTAGRLMTIAGLSPIVIMQVLGHSDLTMVMRYARLWGPDIKNVMAEAMNGNGRG